MLKVELEWPRLNMDLPGSHEHRLEADALLADVALRAALGAFADVANGAQVLLGEAILVALNDKYVVIGPKEIYGSSLAAATRV